MVRPRVRSRIEKRCDLTCCGIHGGKIWSLAGVAASTSQCQILRIVRTAMLTRANVLDVELGPWQRFLKHAAVLAPSMRSLPHKLAQRLIHAYVVPLRWSTPRALA
jgi:hypothetical protein